MDKKQYQMMADLSNTIVVKNYVMGLINGSRSVATDVKLKALRNFVEKVDKEVIDTIMQMSNNIPAVIVKPEPVEVKLEENKIEIETKPKTTKVKKGLVNRVLDE